MDVYEQARRLSHILTDIDSRATTSANDREVYELLNQYGEEFDVDLDLVDMSSPRMSHYRWVIPLRNHTGIAVVAHSSDLCDWKVFEGPDIPAEIANEIKRCAKRKQQTA
jgi:CheY-like chemotaxis protein